MARHHQDRVTLPRLFSPKSAKKVTKGLEQACGLPQRRRRYRLKSIDPRQYHTCVVRATTQAYAYAQALLEGSARRVGRPFSEPLQFTRRRTPERGKKKMF